MASSKQSAGESVPRREHFEHEADIGVRGIGHTLAEAFEQAALAMCAIITDLSRVQAVDTIDIKCKENDYELLLADWLNAIIFEIATRRMLFRSFDVSIHGHVLTAQAHGELIDQARHHPAVEIKGATYTELAVKQTAEGWLAQCVVDV